MRKTTYEWIAEEMDGDDEIVEVHAFDTFDEVKAFVDDDERYDIGIRRDVAEGDCYHTLDIIDRQHAYPGETEFDGGTAIPKKLLAQLQTLED